MIFTDPPYNVPVDGHVSGLGAHRHREFAMASGEMDKPAFTRFLATTFGHIARYSADGALVYAFMDWRHMEEIQAAGQQAFGPLRNLIIWAKTNAGMGSMYRSQHELIFLFRNGKGPHRNNVELGRHGRHRTNVWTYPGANSFGRGVDQEGDLLALHPTPKPVALVADAILDCTARKAIVLDPFLGSGATLIAAEKTGRRCFGLELDPLYVDTIIRRWEALTGGNARLSSGSTFSEVAQERR
jgi:DNA modification methylase